MSVVSESLNPRGVFCESTPNKPGFVTVTIQDHKGFILCAAEMVAEWWDDEAKRVAFSKLDRSDPDYAHKPFSRTVCRCPDDLEPVSSQRPVSSVASLGDQPHGLRLVRAADQKGVA